MNGQLASVVGALAIFGIIGCETAIAQKSGPDSTPAAAVSEFISSLGLSVGSGF